MIKAIALDIDGTITNEKRQLEVQAVNPIRKAEEKGIPICLTTGNVLCFARTASVLLGTTGPLTAEDGGIVYDQKNDEEYLLGDIERVDEGIRVLEKKFENIEYTSDYQLQRTYRTLERTINAEEASEAIQAEDLDLKVVDSGFSIHIKKPDVNKGRALDRVASIIDCSFSEIAAIGDAENDIEMLKKAGLSFVPSNASERAKEISDETMQRPYGVGVQEAIEQILRRI